VAQVRPSSRIPQADLHARRLAVQRKIGPGAPGHPYQGMIAQILANPWEVRDYRDTQTPRLLRRPNAGEQENMRGTNSASAENNLVARHDKRFAAPLDLDPGGACAVEQEPTHQTVGLNR